MKSITRELTKLAVSISWDALPADVVHETKRQLLDSLGCALAARSLDKGRLSVEFARQLGGQAEATLLGEGLKVSCTNAAFANGELMNAMDYDPVVAGYGHVSPFVIPSALALAEREKRSGRQLLLALALGHEVAIRAIRSLEPARRIATDGPNRGSIHLPSVHGRSVVIFGATVAAANLLNLGHDRTAHAIGIAGHFSPVASGVKWTNSVPSSTAKSCSTGWISQTATSAALLASIGYKGDTTVLDGECGYWKFIGSDEWKPEALLTGFGEVWNTLQTIYKVYPCCRAFSGALECLELIIEENSLVADDVESVHCLLDPLLESPIFRRNAIASHVDAQFNLPFVLAAAANKVDKFRWQNDDVIQDSKIQAFMGKVSYSTYPEKDFGLAALDSPTARPSTVRVVAKGSVFERTLNYSKGAYSPTEMRLTDGELDDKFRDNASLTLRPAAARGLADLVRNLEDVKDFSSAFAPVFNL